MGVRRRAAFWVGTVCIASLVTGLATASEAPSEPAVIIKASTPDPTALVGAPPSAPEATLAAAPGEGELTLPAPPAADVVFTPGDRLQAALAARLADTLKDVSPRLPRKEREAIAAYYAATGYQPLWVAEGGWAQAGQAAIRQIKAAAEDGLDPLDYPIPAVASTRGEPVEDWAEADIRLSAAAVLYARDSRGGRIDPTRLSALVTPKLELPSAEDVLGRIAGADAGAALASYHPQHAGYRALKGKLAELRRDRPSTTPMVRVPQGPALRVGMRDPRVPLIRARFGLGPTAGDETAYDERVASAVAAFQKEKGLPASGILTPKTVAALSGPSQVELEGDLVANMERWRWLPSSLGERHILVNIPEYRLRIVQGGDVVHQTRVVVGKTDSQTPVFSDAMEHVIVNPSWTIPPSIMKNEILPGLARDPSYAARRGYEVIRRKDGGISVRQPPGERNALGFVKFIFPNDHAVYLHDTPSRHLFAREQRAYSHGCVRVDQPFRLAAEILSVQGGWPEEKLRGLVGKGERYIRLKEPLPVHLAYFTLAVDETGALKRFDDIYGHNGKVRAALGG